MTGKNYFTSNGADGVDATTTSVGGAQQINKGTSGTGTVKWSTQGTLRRAGMSVIEAIRGTGTGDQVVIRCPFATATSNTMRTRYEFQIPATQSSAVHEIASARYGVASGGKLLKLMRGTTGTVYLLDQADAACGPTMLTNAQAPAGAWFDLVIDEGTTAAGSAGVVKAHIENTAGAAVGTPVNVTNAKLSDSSGAQQPWGCWDVPIISSGNESGYKMRIGVLQTDDAAGSSIPAYSTGSNQKPTASYAVPIQRGVVAGATVTNTLNGSDPDGSIASYLHEIVTSSDPSVTLTNATSQTCSFVAGAAGSIVILKGTVTDNGGLASDPTYKTITVPASATTALPLAIPSSGGWTRVGSATSDGAAMADSDDTSYMESPALSSTPTTLRFRIAPTVNKSGQMVAPVRLRRTTTAGSPPPVRVMEGTTNRGTMVGDAGNPSQVSISAWATFNYALSDITGITDYENLFGEIDGVL